MRIQFTFGRMMAAVALIALALILASTTHAQFLWSWRAFARPKEWRITQTIARENHRAELAARDQLRAWRASRARIAAEYQTEARRLRGRGRPGDGKQAAEYEKFAAQIQRGLKDGTLGITKADLARRKFLSDRSGIDLADGALMALACVCVGFICLIIPTPWRRRPRPTRALTPLPHAVSGIT